MVVRKIDRIKAVVVMVAVLALCVLCGLACTQSQGTFTDSRDGKTYRTVRIGNLTWMAENLNNAISGSWCYDNDDSNCAKYGRLYTWNAAMRVCPAGWRLPTEDDWVDLIQAAGGEDEAGGKLKSKTGWDDNGNGADDFGFSALPGGVREEYGDFEDIGSLGHWWSSTDSYGLGDHVGIYSSGDDVQVNCGDSDNRAGYSVRCVKD